MSDIVDHFFPPLSHSNKCTSNEFSNVNYWRHPMPVVDPMDLAIASCIDEKTKLAAITTNDSPSIVTASTVTTAISFGDDARKTKS